ncbi:helix-turn-helix domain-containing protein [Brevibacillus sp. BC25]|uniref:helix-turn-helix domain-containing protein n=1 Tax=unclassified Brevibacillus TaxID=2684853 RepID=UPI00027103D7|nr:XRE family transcriptional regulator [Brevibacillus sp. BC25]EJL27941.1 putative transcriptional regulator [Brevibacillus sp. BC25]
MEEFHTNIGENIKRIRKERNLSLDKTSEITGVSKTMLGQIERGKSAPTITTLWKIASGLRLSFSSLVSQFKPNVTIVKKKEVNPIIENNGQYRVYPLVPYNPEQQFEIFSVTLEPGCEHIAEPHSTGVEEFILVNEGTLEVVVNEQVYIVEPEDTLIFKADRPHIYRNNGDRIVKCSVVIHYSSQ